MKVDIAFCEEVGLHQLIEGNKLSIVPNTYKNHKELIEKSYIATFQLDYLFIRVSWTPDPRLDKPVALTNCGRSKLTTPSRSYVPIV
jgi:hypothetical protein